MTPSSKLFSFSQHEFARKDDHSAWEVLPRHWLQSEGINSYSTTGFLINGMESQGIEFSKAQQQRYDQKLKKLVVDMQVAELEFSRDRKMMSVLCHRGGTRPVLFVKGSPESVIEQCSHVSLKALLLPICIGYFTIKTCTSVLAALLRYSTYEVAGRCSLRSSSL